VVSSEGKRPLEKPRYRWKNNVKINLWKVRWGHKLDRSVAGQKQVAGSCECGDEL
jgi:hypothetical protein